MVKKRKMLALDEQVTENLRRIYRETADEPVPDRFKDLLKRLQEQEKQAGGSSDAGDGDR